MRFIPRFRNGFWSAFDTVAYRPGFPQRSEADAIEQAREANARVKAAPKKVRR